MLVVIIILGVIFYKLLPVVGETGLAVLIGVFFFAVPLIVRVWLATRGGGSCSGGGYSIDELEFFDMMDED